MILCAIHQPNFFPWLGYFDKIRRADTFVFLDRAHYPKSGSGMGSWCNRVRVNVNGDAVWISCAVKREHGPQPIHTVKINDSTPWRDRIRRTLEFNYKKAPNFDSAFPLLDELLRFETDSLAEFNVNAVTRLARHLDLNTRLVRETELPPTGAVATERLIELVREVGADGYLSGGGAEGYQDDEAFARAGLELVYQDFRPEPYGDPERFIPGLSVIDWLMYGDFSLRV